ncbi:UNVERIFIED_CONTAM: hypothetical protein FKN15_063830 [Acipenser sinensis]
MPQRLGASLPSVLQSLGASVLAPSVLRHSLHQCPWCIGASEPLCFGAPEPRCFHAPCIGALGASPPSMPQSLGASVLHRPQCLDAPSIGALGASVPQSLGALAQFVPLVLWCSKASVLRHPQCLDAPYVLCCHLYPLYLRALVHQCLDTLSAQTLCVSVLGPGTSRYQNSTLARHAEFLIQRFRMPSTSQRADLREQQNVNL